MKPRYIWIPHFYQIQYVKFFFSKTKTEEYNQKVWNIFDQFGITIPCSATHFLQVGARVSLKVTTKGSLRGKTTVISEERDQEDWIVSDTFGIITSCSATYHLVVGGPVSLSLATKASFGGKKTPKLWILRLHFQRKNGVVRPKKKN